jgi:hypothetical protein
MRGTAKQAPVRAAPGDRVNIVVINENPVAGVAAAARCCAFHRRGR